MIHVRIVPTLIRRNKWSAYQIATTRILQFAVVGIPDVQSSLGNSVSLFHLRTEECRNNFAGQVGGSNVNPCRFVYLTTKELAPIGPFFANDRHVESMWGR